MREFHEWPHRLKCETCGSPVAIHYGMHGRRIYESLFFEVLIDRNDLFTRLKGAERRIIELQKELNGS